MAPQTLVSLLKTPRTEDSAGCFSGLATLLPPFLQWSSLALTMATYLGRQIKIIHVYKHLGVHVVGRKKKIGSQPPNFIVYFSPLSPRYYAHVMWIGQVR